MSRLTFIPISLSVLLCSLSMPTILQAENANGPTPTEDARAILVASNMQQMMDIMFGQLVPLMESGFIGQLTKMEGGDNLMQQIDSEYPGGREAFGKRFGELMMTGMRAKYPDIIEKAAQQYVAEFEPDELVAIRSFLESSTGVRMTAVQPKIQQQMSIAGQAIGRKVGEEAAIQLMTEAGKYFGAEQ